MRQSGFLFWLGAMTLTGAILRFGLLGAQAPSIDEGWSVGAVLGDVDHLLDVLAHDTHPPLYFLLQWLQVRAFGPGILADRLVTAAFGTLAVPLTMLIARRALPVSMTAFVGLLAAFSPLALFTSRDARPHMMAATLILAATWLLIEAVERPTWTRIVLYAATAAAAVLTSYASLVVLAAHGLALVVLRVRSWTRWLVAVLVAALIAGPWLAYEAPHLGQAHNILFSDPSIGAADRLRELVRIATYSLTGGFTLLDELNLLLAALVLLPVIGALGWSAFARREADGTPAADPAVHPGHLDPRAWVGLGGEEDPALIASRARTTRIVCITMVIGLLGFYAVTSALGGQFVARYLTPLIGPAAVLYAVAIYRLPLRARTVAAALLLLGWSWTWTDVLTRDKAHRDASEVAAYLDPRVQLGDAVVFDWFSTRGQTVGLVPRLWQISAEGGYDLSSDEGRASAHGGVVWLVADNTMADRRTLLASIQPLTSDVALGPRRVIAFAPRTVARAGP